MKGSESKQATFWPFKNAHKLFPLKLLEIYRERERERERERAEKKENNKPYISAFRTLVRNKTTEHTINERQKCEYVLSP